MPIRRTLPFTLAATLACAALTGSAAHADDGATFRDVLKPGGKERSVAEKFADGTACGTYGPKHTIPFMPAFEKCMNARGWVLDHYTTNEARPAAGGTTTHYVDVKGDGDDHERGDAALQVDTRSCRKTAKTDAAVNACLADRGWKITLTQYGPALPRPRVAAAPQSSWSSWSSSGSYDTSVDDEIRRDDEQRRNDQSNRDIQAASDAINQAIQQTNEMNAAAAEQVQIQNNIANMPTFGQ
jgi:hypothetical protein